MKKFVTAVIALMVSVCAMAQSEEEVIFTEDYQEVSVEVPFDSMAGFDSKEWLVEVDGQYCGKYGSKYLQKIDYKANPSHWYVDLDFNTGESTQASNYVDASVGLGLHWKHFEAGVNVGVMDFESYKWDTVIKEDPITKEKYKVKWHSEANNKFVVPVYITLRGLIPVDNSDKLNLFVEGDFGGVSGMFDYSNCSFAPYMDLKLGIEYYMSDHVSLLLGGGFRDFGLGNKYKTTDYKCYDEALLLM